MAAPVLLTLGCPPDAAYNYCTALANSTGQAAGMHWQGSTSIADNNFRLWAEHCPPNQFGLFFFGSKSSEFPYGDGHLCATGGLHRLPVVNTGVSGQPSYLLDFTSLSQISAGDTWFFSCWFRDPPGGPAGFNFADGLRATFCP